MNKRTSDFLLFVAELFRPCSRWRGTCPFPFHLLSAQDAAYTGYPNALIDFLSSHNESGSSFHTSRRAGKGCPYIVFAMVSYRKSFLFRYEAIFFPFLSIPPKMLVQPTEADCTKHKHKKV